MGQARIGRHGHRCNLAGLGESTEFGNKALRQIDVAARVFSNDPRFAQGRFLLLTGERAEESAARARYASVSAQTGVPWWVIGLIHMMEAGQSFRCHLHNGDPLTARTVQVPAGRPKTGQPPFIWEESAADALLVELFPFGRRQMRFELLQIGRAHV